VRRGVRVAQPVHEVIARWTLLPDDLALLVRKAAENRLRFGLLLKFYIDAGRFPV
jgi:hypothetical protein